MLGFEDCSAKTDSVTAAELSLAKPYIKEHEELAPKAWSFYGFDITPDDYQVVINVATEAGGPDDACASPSPWFLTKSSRPCYIHFSSQWAVF